MNIDSTPESATSTPPLQWYADGALKLKKKCCAIATTLQIKLLYIYKKQYMLEETKSCITIQS